MRFSAIFGDSCPFWRTAIAGVVLVVLSFSAHAQDGASLFQTNCSTCHKIDAPMTGPALKGVTDRWEGKLDLLHKWVKGPSDVVEMGDPYVTQLVAEWKPKSGMMPAQNVNDEEIDAILSYIKDWKPEENKKVAATGGGQATGEGNKGSGNTWAWFLAIGLVLLIIIFSLSNVSQSLENSVRTQHGQHALPERTYGQIIKQWMWRNKAFVSIIGLLIVVILSVRAYQGLMGIGVYTGYHPEQPIKFPHKVHAGDNEIACVYCHHSADEGKHAGVPSVNICMNCHTGINEGSDKQATQEIHKIYDAVGWDLETREYTGDTHPVKWVKVHNLPDLVYFNHAQHVKVGGIDCKKCHGPVEEYTTGKQYAELTMGWCINCHNETAVPMKGGYYKEIHKRLETNGRAALQDYLKDGVITERELGGWECVKCHY